MNLKLFKYLCKMKQSDLKKTVGNYLKSKYKKVIETPDYIIAEGELSICLVAHLDTVFKQLPHEFFYDKEQGVLWSPQGLGADDRAGIYAILTLVDKGYKPSIILTTDEEKGGLGAKALIKKYPDSPFGNLKAIIELDRQGQDDCVFYECDNPDFEKYIEKFGFKTDFGSFSDISFIAPAWGIAAVNLSVGYIEEHSFCERLYTEYLDDTIKKVALILEDSEDMKSYAYIPLTFPAVGRCIACNKASDNMIRIQGTQHYMCENCCQLYYQYGN